MKIRYMSDLHLEFTGYEASPTDIGEDVVVLAGDIGTGLKGIDWALRTFKRPEVIYVLGNHEFYREDFDSLIVEARHAVRGTNVHVLEQGTAEIGGVLFAGCTLWTDFDLYGSQFRQACMAKAARAMTDYQLISRRGVRISPEETRARCEASKTWLQRTLEQAGDLPCVVVTHTGPAPAARNPAYAETDPLTPAFITDLSQLMKPPVRAWFHGHHHYTYSGEVNGVPLHSNQRGYPGEPAMFDWDRAVTVSVG